MNPARPARLSRAAVLVLLLLAPLRAAARYPLVAQDAQGTWVATDDALILIVGDLWTFYGTANGLPGDRVRMVAPDEHEVWAATNRGLGRMDRNSRRWEILQAPDPLPSNRVLCASFDDRFAWIGTDRGAVRFNKMARTWTRVDEPQGPGQQPVTFILTTGQTVWMAAGEGVFLYDRQTQRWQHIGKAEGLAIGAIDEILQVGENLWFLGQEGIARYDLRSRAVASFTEKEGLPSPRVAAFASVQGEIWIGTDLGMVTYNPSSDAISPFIHQEGMPPGGITGIEVALPYVWVSTEGGVAAYNTLNATWEGKKEADGLVTTNILGMTLTGSSLVLIQPDTFQAYDTQRDEWRTFPIDDVWAGKTGGAAADSGMRWNLELTMDGEGKFALDSSSGRWTNNGQLFPDLRVGLGTLLEGGRTLDASVGINGSWLWPVGKTMHLGVRDYSGELRLRGNDSDNVKELLVSAKLPLQGQENTHRLIDDAWLEGAGVYARAGDRAGRKTDPVTVEAEAGLNRGVRAREFFRGSIDTSFTLAHQYITPGSVLVKVDGMIMERDVDYIITHTTGQLSFLNPDLVNALSLIEITYTYEQIPREGLESRSLLQMLPLDNELGSFKRAGTPVYVTDESGLTKQIDGAAPKYLDRGWQEGVFMDYTQGSSRVSVVISDMATPEQAQAIFDFDQPISRELLWQDADSIAVLDQGLPTAYAVKMRMDRYYVEISIDEKSKSAEILIKLFAQDIHTKGSLSGTLLDSLRPFVWRTRVGLSPSDHWGAGASVLGQQDLENPAVTERYKIAPGWRNQTLLDAWTKHELGEGAFGGELSSFLQLGRSQSQNGLLGERSGSGISGNVLYNAPALNLRLDGEAQSHDFETLGSRDTVLGTFQNDLRADATLSPLPWLPLRLVYDREQSQLSPELAPNGSGSGINENLLGKLSFSKAKWPTIWFLVGRSVLEGNGHRDEKLRLAGSLEYDLAHGILDSLGMKKLTVYAYYDHSANDIPSEGHAGQSRWLGLGSAPGAADNLRVELRAAPTSTEDGYARFERKTFSPSAQAQAVGGIANPPRPLEAWELVGGAASRYLPGIVPTINAKLSYQKGEDSQGVQQETAQSLLSGQLELFPGRWIEALGTTRLAAAYGYTDGETSSGPEKTMELQKHEVDGALSYGKYDDPFRFESRSRWWTVHQGEKQDESERYLEVLNRATYRPIYVSPITLRFDFSDLAQLLFDHMGETRTLSPSLEWERRWSLDLITRVRLETPVQFVDNLYDQTTGVAVSGKNWSLKPWEEVRWRLTDLWAGSLVRLTLRAYQQSTRADGRGMEEAFELYTSFWVDWEKPGVFIVRLGAGHTWHHCLDKVGLGASACRSGHVIAPSITAIARF